MDGYNATVFAYGATGAGKTYTMLGNDEQIGIMGLTFKELFRRIDHARSTKNIKVSMSYLEIYNESIKDLIKSDNKA